jgi:hypothetical protein
MLGRKQIKQMQKRPSTLPANGSSVFFDPRGNRMADVVLQPVQTEASFHQGWSIKP